MVLSALAGGVMFSGGEAKALTCDFDSSISQNFSIKSCSDGTTNPNPPLNGGTVYNDTWHETNNAVGIFYPTDKQIKFISGPTGGKGDIEWKWIDVNGNGTWGAHPDLHVDEWHVDVDFNPDFNTPAPGIGANPSVFEYIVRITPSPAPNNKAIWFQDVALGAIFGPSNGGASSVKKDIYSVLNHGKGDYLGMIICSAPAIGGSSCGPNVELPLNTYDKLYVVDTATFGGRTIDAYQNVFRQTPGPLPVLGAGAAFGFTRKLRARIKATRTA